MKKVILFCLALIALSCKKEKPEPIETCQCREVVYKQYQNQTPAEVSSTSPANGNCNDNGQVLETWQVTDPITLMVFNYERKKVCE